jgi:hypothetical protein
MAIVGSDEEQPPNIGGCWLFASLAKQDPQHLQRQQRFIHAFLVPECISPAMAPRRDDATTSDHGPRR